MDMSIHWRTWKPIICIKWLTSNIDKVQSLISNATDLHKVSLDWEIYIILSIQNELSLWDLYFINKIGFIQKVETNRIPSISGRRADLHGLEIKATAVVRYSKKRKTYSRAK